MISKQSFFYKFNINILLNTTMRFELYTAEKRRQTGIYYGNFNSWNPKDYNFQLKQIDPSGYFIEIEDQLLPDDIEYKFTKEAGKT